MFGDDEGMGRGQIVLDRQIKEGENSYDEDSRRGKKGHRRRRRRWSEKREPGQ